MIELLVILAAAGLLYLLIRPPVPNAQAAYPPQLRRRKRVPEPEPLFAAKAVKRGPL